MEHKPAGLFKLIEPAARQKIESDLDDLFADLFDSNTDTWDFLRELQLTLMRIFHGNRYGKVDDE